MDNRWWVIALLILTASCTKHGGYNQFVSIDEKGWRAHNVIHFKPQLNDSTSLFDLSLAVRHTNNYPYQNLWLFVAYKEETDIRFDTLQLVLADEFGRWKGAGSGPVRIHNIPYKSGVRFEKGGTCAISVKQAMFDEGLRGVVDVGLIIEKTR